MGFGSIVSGYINIEGDVRAAVERIEALPTYDRDEWPFLPREAFGLQIAKAEIAAGGSLNVTYKGECIIPFGMCVKEIDGEWEQWLTKFEHLFQSMDASEAFVMLRLTNGITSDDFDGRFFYHWTIGDNWKFVGEPRSF